MLKFVRLFQIGLVGIAVGVVGLPIAADFMLHMQSRQRLLTPTAEALEASRERNFRVLCTEYRDTTWWQRNWHMREHSWCKDYYDRLDTPLT